MPVMSRLGVVGERERAVLSHFARGSKKRAEGGARGAAHADAPAPIRESSAVQSDPFAPISTFTGDRGTTTAAMSSP
jgi:hypothetical protein